MLKVILKFSFFIGVCLFLLGADAEPIMKIKICDGTDETPCAKVQNINGVNRVQTTGLVQIDQLFGQYPKGSTWFYIGTELDSTGVGAAGDIVTVTIPAGVNPDGGSCAAVDVDTTVTAGMVADDNPEIALAAQIVSDLNGDANFAPCWKAIRMKDFSGVFIESDFFSSYGVRTSWDATTTGTTVVTKGFDDISLRGLGTELTQSPNDPRQGVLGIAGSLQLTPGGAVNLFTEKALNGGSEDMNVDGSGTTQTFCIDPDATNEKIVQFLTFSGTDNGIKYSQFLAISTLSNGILVRFKSEDNVGQFGVIDTTDDFEDGWANRPSDFSLAIQAGGDHFNGTKDLTESTIILSPTGTYATDDYVCVDIRDNLTAINELNFRAKGFLREP